MSLAIATAAGSAGQIVGPMVAVLLLESMPWQSIFIIFAASILAVLLLLPFMKSPGHAAKEEIEESLGEILRIAMKASIIHDDLRRLFSCGYQLAFITAHFPAPDHRNECSCGANWLVRRFRDRDNRRMGGFAISVIGAANIVGTLMVGWAGKRFGKKWLLSGIYAGRFPSIAAAWFILTPITANTVLIFSFAMGFLWLCNSSTNQRISGSHIRAQIYGNIVWDSILFPSDG